MSDESPALHRSGAPCVLCGGEAEPWIEKGGYRHLRCTGCGTAFLAPDEVPADLGSLYGADYFEGKEAHGYPTYLRDAPLSERNFDRRLAWIEALQPPGRLLEVGCAYGLFLARARQRGWDVAGVEIAEDCAREAAAACGAPVTTGDFLETELPGGFDVVVMLDVIEHMPDPVACVARSAELLAPGGWLVLETGNIASAWARTLGRRWHFIDPPQHLVYFTRRSMAAMLRGQGFERVEVRRLGREVSLANIAFKLFGRAAGPLLRLPGFLYVNLGDTQLVAAQRR
jgi:SAM-dependent methyltransferase